MENEAPDEDTLRRDAEEGAGKHLAGEDKRRERPPVVWYLSPLGNPLQEKPRHTGYASCESHAADGEIYQARDHRREQQRIDPPIFRRSRILCDAVEESGE